MSYQPTQIQTTKTARVAVQFKNGTSGYLKRSVGASIRFDAYGNLANTFLLGPESWTASKAHAAKFTPIEARVLGDDINARLEMGLAPHINFSMS